MNRLIMIESNEEKCLNCAAQLSGEFCSQCGQAKGARLVPLTVWVSSFSEAFLSFDFKLVATIKQLLLRPGQATLDFAEGRRVKFTSPAHIYILLSAVSIAAMTFQGAFSPQNPSLVQEIQNNQEIQNRIQFLFPFVNLLSPFLTAFILAILQRKDYYQLHMAFSLHLWSFLILIGTPLIFVPPNAILWAVVFLILSVLLTWYVLTAHRRVYQVSKWKWIFNSLLLLLSLPLNCVLFLMLLVFLATTF